MSSRQRSVDPDFGYQQSFNCGYLIGCMMSIIEIVRLLESLEWDTKHKANILDISENYYDEIVAIMDKYPRYSLEHLAQKVIFEASYLPY